MTTFQHIALAATATTMAGLVVGCLGWWLTSRHPRARYAFTNIIIGNLPCVLVGSLALMVATVMAS